MDPQAVWNNMIDAYEAQDWDAACEAAEALRGWLGRGGFPPTTLYLVLDAKWHRAATLAVCNLVLENRQGQGSSG